MSFFLYRFFHRKTNERIEEGKQEVPEDIEDWPPDWLTIFYKEYKLFKPVPLTKPEGSLWNIVQKRQASGRLLSKNVVSFDTLSYILGCGYGLQRDDAYPKRGGYRTVPSAGQRYPLEVYVLLFREKEGVGSGVFHYDIRGHALTQVTKRDFTEEDVWLFTQQKTAVGAHGMICITSVFNRTVDKYGSRGYRYMLLEAGHVAQNMMLAATERSATLLPVGGSSERKLEETIGLNVDLEGVLYTLFF